MPDKTREYRGVRLPVDVIQQIQSAGNEWRRIDKDRWGIAGQCEQIVGLYIPDATQALAAELGYSSASTPEGWAKASKLRRDLQTVKHDAPLAGLYFSHYVVAGKAYYSDTGGVSLDAIDKILRDANQYQQSVEWLRHRIRKEFGNVPEDSWENSARMQIKSIEAHIVNSPRLGVDSYKSRIAAQAGRVFVSVLRWAIGDAEVNQDVISLFDLDAV